MNFFTNMWGVIGEIIISPQHPYLTVHLGREQGNPQPHQSLRVAVWELNGWI